MLDVLCLGNALIDCFLSLSHPEKDVRVDASERFVTFSLGAKVPVDHVSFFLGGNACNVSVGLSRLGKKSGLIAEIGSDMFARTIQEGLIKEHVDTELLEQTQGPSSFAVSISAKKDRVLFVEHVLRKHAFRVEDFSGKWLYLTSLGKEWKHAYQDALSFAKRHDVKIAFNPGTPQFEDGVESFNQVLLASDILFVNKEEADQILASELEDKRACLLALQKMGPKLVVLTDGQKGSYAIDESGEIMEEGILERPVVERTGAGDAYIAGFLGAYIGAKNMREAMKWGTRNAASVIGKVGSQPGLLTREEIEKEEVG